jgi:hypothetical protein
MGVLLLVSGTTELSVCMRMSLSTINVGSREHLGRCRCDGAGERQSAEDPGRDTEIPPGVMPGRVGRLRNREASGCSIHGAIGRSHAGVRAPPPGSAPGPPMAAPRATRTSRTGRLHPSRLPGCGPVRGQDLGFAHLTDKLLFNRT